MEFTGALNAETLRLAEELLCLKKDRAFCIVADGSNEFLIPKLRTFENCALLGYYGANNGNFLSTFREY